MSAHDSPAPLVLIVDDEPRYVRVLKFNLERDHFRTIEAPDGPTAVRLAEAQRPDLILLDVGLPGWDGFEVCRHIRTFSSAPIIMLTAKAAEQDKVTGLDAGADDYLTKPFGIPELFARIRAVLRRAQKPAELPQFTHITSGDLHIDLGSHTVTVRGREVRLSPTEYRLLEQLALRTGNVVTNEEILLNVWGPEYSSETQHVRLYISRLRQKIEADPEHPQLIMTRTAVGYYLRITP
ncbi:MAG: response regulator transcription factor [Chloroflexi bacterium]|nr:response regulator transcription factor [Chloroflexota bacterium]